VSTEKDETLRIVEWTRTPGPREIKQGEWSAERYNQEILRPAFDRVLKSGGVLTVDMDGTAGYLPSFVDETFGGLARDFGTETVIKHLKIVYNDDPYTLEDAWDNVRNPKPRKRPLR
jgi:hypothetical protein